MERFQMRKDWSGTLDQKDQELNDCEKSSKIISNPVTEIYQILICLKKFKPF